MNFFNIDLHISVIADIKHIFNKLGHNVTNWSISGANSVMGWPTAKVDIVNQKTWERLDHNMCDQFYNRYKNELDKYDAFIVTFTPTFAWLYERFNKPIIIVAPIRYELPFTNKPDLWNQFNQYLINGIDSKKIIAIGNNMFDKTYGEYFTGRTWGHIPSLCEYTNTKYSGVINKVLYSSRYKQYSHYLGGSWLDNVINKEEALPSGYKWSDLTKYSGIIQIPYNHSTMSIFENYTQCMPMFFPSYDFMRVLRSEQISSVLSESTWTQTWGLESRSVVEGKQHLGFGDPNDFKNIDTFMNWVRFADWYDSRLMPDVIHFNDFHQLRELLKATNYTQVSKNMAATNEFRRDLVYRLWREVIGSIR